MLKDIEYRLKNVTHDLRNIELEVQINAEKIKNFEKDQIFQVREFELTQEEK